MHANTEAVGNLPFNAVSTAFLLPARGKLDMLALAGAWCILDFGRDAVRAFGVHCRCSALGEVRDVTMSTNDAR